MNRIHSRRMDTSFFHTKFPTTSRAEGAVSSANTGMLPFTGSSQLQQQQTSNYPRPPRATDDPSRHSTVSAAPVGGRPDLATVETTARGPLHPLRGAAPDQKGCTAYGSAAAPRITRTNAESARRAPTISQASSMIGPKATTATKAHNVWTRGYDTAPGACIKQRPPRGIHYQW